MKSFLKTKRRPEAGFGTLVITALKICRFHYLKFGNYDVYVEDEELAEIFDFIRHYEIDQYTFDIDREVMAGLQSGNIDPDMKRISAHYVCDENLLREKHAIFNEIFSLKNPEWYEEERARFITDKTLGVHLRGTDKHTEVRPPNLPDIYRYIEYFLGHFAIDNVFLATDDIVFQYALTQRFGNVVKFRKQTVSLDGRPVHFGDNRSIVFKEAMADAYLLSKCSYLLYGFSNVSYLSLVMGIHNFRKIACLNASFFYSGWRDDMSEQRDA